jgi:tetratricopeptide (TPR) repeat protein
MKKLFITILFNVFTALLFAQSTAEQQANALALEAKNYLMARKDAEGLASAEKALVLDPQNIDALILKTTALSNLKRFDEAIKTITAGIKLYPEENMMYGLRAFVYRMMGKTDLAAADEAKSAAAGNKPLEGQDDECILGNCRTGYGTIQFPSGNKYVGNFVDRKRQGRGTFYFANGDQFEGTFDKDLRQNGTYKFNTGYRFAGTFLNEDFYNGTFTTPEGSQVEMVNGKVIAPTPKMVANMPSGAAGKLTCANQVSCPHCHGKGISYQPIEQKLSWSTKDSYSVDRYGNKNLTYAGQSGGNTYSIPNYVPCGRCGGKGSICK